MLSSRSTMPEEKVKAFGENSIFKRPASHWNLPSFLSFWHPLMQATSLGKFSLLQAAELRSNRPGEVNQKVIGL